MNNIINFSDYLNFLESQIDEINPKTATKGEIEQIRSHTATPETMQKHLSNYKKVKYVVENLGVKLNL